MRPEAFLAFADPLPEAMLLTGSDGVVRAANRAAGKLLRYRPADLAGRPLANLAAGDGQRLRYFLTSCARSRELLPGSSELVTGDGEAVKLRVDGAIAEPRREGSEGLVILRLRPQERTLDRFQLLNQRITDLSREIVRRKNAERALAAQRSRLEVTLASIADAVIATDRELRISLMNPVAEGLTGWPSREAEGKHLDEVLELVDAGSRERRRPAEEVLASGVASGIFNHTLLLPRSGDELAIDHNAAPIRDSAGDVIGVVLSFRDVGERYLMERQRTALLDRERRARASAEAADRTKDEFLATLSHELRAPLQAIGNWTSLLESQAADPELAARAAERIQRNLAVQTQLVEDLLDASHIAAGQVRIERRRLALAPVVEAACADVRHEAESKGIRLALDLDRGAEVTGDGERLRQVMRNLLSNALKFTPESGDVEIRLEHLDCGARITVSDSGEGIAPDALDHVFDRFRQADASRTRAHGGLGLGLTIARHLVELHGGTLEGASQGPGQGATFTVTLPETTAPDDA